MSYIVSETWLKNKLKEKNEDIAIIDVRFNMQNPEEGKQKYLEGHIPQAVFLDIEKDLSGKVEKHGGKHPLPKVDTLSEKLGSIGIDNETTVVFYDEDGSMFAARGWWILHYMGHDHVYILEGGFQRWVAAGHEVVTDIVKRKQKTFRPQIRNHIAVQMEEVKNKLKDDSSVLIDARSKERYLGKTEPLYNKAGHIPGAKNFFWKDVYNEDGTWKNKEQLEKQFSSLTEKEEIIVSCGSGLSACPNFIALKIAGFDNVKLYPGSFSDWISYENNEIETKEE